MINKSSRTTKIVVTVAAVLALVMAIVISNMFMASTAVTTINNLMNKFNDALAAIYSGLLAIVSILAAVVLAICFITKMYSKNPRSVDEANQWMKRVAFAWLGFMLISVFFKVGIDIVKDSGANTAKPWD